MSVGETFSDVNCNISGCFVKSPPLTLPSFTDKAALLLSVASSEFIELFLPTATFDIFIRERWTYLSMGTKVVKTIRGFKYSVAIRSKPIKIQAVIFLSAWLLFISFQLHILVLLLENKTRPFFRSYSSFFNEVRLYWFMKRDSTTYTDRSALVDTWSSGTVGWHQSLL